jgi:hypothetical protein
MSDRRIYRNNEIQTLDQRCRLREVRERFGMLPNPTSISQSLNISRPIIDVQ